MLLCLPTSRAPEARGCWCRPSGGSPVRGEKPEAASGGASSPAAPADGGGNAQPQSGEASANGETASTPPQPEGPRNTRFYLSTPLDTMRINKDVNNLVQEVINYLSGLDGAAVEITLEVSAKLTSSRCLLFGVDCNILFISTGDAADTQEKEGQHHAVKELYRELYGRVYGRLCKPYESNAKHDNR